MIKRWSYHFFLIAPHNNKWYMLFKKERERDLACHWHEICSSGPTGWEAGKDEAPIPLLRLHGTLDEDHCLEIQQHSLQLLVLWSCHVHFSSSSISQMKKILKLSETGCKDGGIRDVRCSFVSEKWVSQLAIGHWTCGRVSVLGLLALLRRSGTPENVY